MYSLVGQVLYVLREPSGRKNGFVGKCSVHGQMDGSAVMSREGSGRWIHLRDRVGCEEAGDGKAEGDLIGLFRGIRGARGKAFLCARDVYAPLIVTGGGKLPAISQI